MNEKRRIITFTRRSDPAPYTRWLLSRLDEGFCDVPNPFSGKPYRVSLRPDDVALFTFWTKNPVPLVDPVRIMKERGFRVALFITVTGYPRHIERNVPEPGTIATAVSRLAGMLGTDALWWRYDPVIFSRKLDESWHMANFESLCSSIWNGNSRRVTFSLAHLDGPYRRARAALESALLSDGDMLEIPPFRSPGYDALYERTLSLLSSLSAIARSYRIPDAEVCCSPRLKAGEARIAQGHCLDLGRIRRLVPDLGNVPAAPTRKGISMHANGYADCGCVKSVDIGTNGTCPHGCVYCYANRSGMNRSAIDMLSRG